MIVDASYTNQEAHFNIILQHKPGTVSIGPFGEVWKTHGNHWFRIQFPR